MVAKPKILCVGHPAQQDQDLLDHLREAYEVVIAEDALQAQQTLSDSEISNVLVSSERFAEQGREQTRIVKLLQDEQILAGMPDGVVLLDDQNTVFWANPAFGQWTIQEPPVGQSFYEALGDPEILGDGACPFASALSRHQSQTSTLRCAENRYCQVHVVPIRQIHPDKPRTLIATVRDVTSEILQQQKMAAIHQAGIELADLTTEEVFNMEVEERIELLKSNILHYTKDLLNFDVVEIRLLGEDTGILMPLLSVGLVDSAAERPLKSCTDGNGVTGYVAATARSYLCQDTTKDPLYIEGCKDAKSSMTVPLIQHDQVIGTFNVESPEPNAFTKEDLQFLEIFSRDVAAALNTLELLVAQQANTAQASVEAIHREVALPVDEILNDAVNVMERYIGHEPGVTSRLKRILQNARDIKQLIHKVGQELAPAEAVPHFAQVPERQILRRKKILVVDADEAVRGAAHDLLERFACVVETAHEGGEAVFMVRNVGNEQRYDVIIADINLPDMSGYELMLKLREIITPTPLVLMKGFGYDPGHAMVKARQAGLHPKAVLYKPFRLDQLLEVCETMIHVYGQPTT